MIKINSLMHQLRCNEVMYKLSGSEKYNHEIQIIKYKLFLLTNYEEILYECRN